MSSGGNKMKDSTQIVLLDELKENCKKEEGENNLFSHD